MIQEAEGATRLVKGRGLATRRLAEEAEGCEGLALHAPGGQDPGHLLSQNRTSVVRP